MSLKAQEVDLRTRPDIVIGTPGRIIDHLQNSPSVHFDNVDILVSGDDLHLLYDSCFTKMLYKAGVLCG